MFLSIATSLAALSLIASLIMFLMVRRVVRRDPQEGSSSPLSVFKPLKGVDSELESNLRSFFTDAGDRHQLILGAPFPEDTANAIADKICAEFPDVDAVVVPGHDPRIMNPKVATLNHLLQHASYDQILISDSNVLVPEGYLDNLAHRLSEESVGIVVSPFRGTEASGIGGGLEALHLNSYVVGGICALNELTRQPCVVGKSMAFRRSDLDAIGGFEELGRYLGEDQVCGEDVAERGGKVVVADILIDNILGDPGLRGFIRRQLRWAMIRRRIKPIGYLAEILLLPISIVLSMGLFALLLGHPVVLWGLLFVFTWFLKGAIEHASESEVGVRRNLATTILLSLVKDIVLFGVWWCAWFKRSISWRGDEVQIGARSKLIPSEASGRQD